MALDHLSAALPRVLIVSRRALRKDKFVDFVGEYHLDLIVEYGAVPVIVPRVSGIEKVLESFEPIHGVLLCEGEDIDPLWYHQSEDVDSSLSPEEAEEIKRLHASDTSIDKVKDSIELRLTRLCVDRGVPYLGICRGSQVLNVSCGGTLYQDIGKQVSRNLAQDKRVAHIDYNNYDGHRHPIRIVEGTPLDTWFNKDSSEDKLVMVNSYHHQGVRKLAPRFVPMAFSPDGLIEGFYDPNMYEPDEGRFVMGLQFHPERMRQPGSNDFDYSGCPYVYKEFVRAVLAYQKKVDIKNAIPKTLKPNVEIEHKRRVIARSFSLAKDLYLSGTKISTNICTAKEAPVELKARAEFLESSALSSQHEVPLKEMRATVRNAYSCFERMKANDECEKVARKIMSRMSIDQLTDLMSFYRMMGNICDQVVETKIHEVVNDHVFRETI